MIIIVFHYIFSFLVWTYHLFAIYYIESKKQYLSLLFHKYKLTFVFIWQDNDIHALIVFDFNTFQFYLED